VTVIVIFTLQKHYWSNNSTHHMTQLVTWPLCWVTILLYIMQGAHLVVGLWLVSQLQISWRGQALILSRDFMKKWKGS